MLSSAPNIEPILCSFVSIFVACPLCILSMFRFLFKSISLSPTLYVCTFSFSLSPSISPAKSLVNGNSNISALQPWTPCLPIRGGKLKTSKHFSTSNPQLPFLCNSTGSPFPGNSGAHNQQSSTNSLNSSYIWREASPNNFNMYSTSVSSLNACGYRYSLTGAAAAASNASGGGGGGSGTSSALDYRALSEERATRKSLNRLKSGFGSGYDNIFITPLLSRKNKPTPKLVKNLSTSGSAYQTTHQRSPPRRNHSAEEQPPTNERFTPIAPGLYDRRLNRSFDAPSQRYAGYGGGYMMGCGGLKTNVLRRSTPHLAGDELCTDSDETDCHGRHHGCGGSLLGNGSSGHCGADANHSASGPCAANGDADSQRQSGTWCCGNFVMKQWRKINNY